MTMMLTGLRSRKHIAPFDPAYPTSVEECCAWLARPERTAVMAGGLDLIDRMKAGEPFDTIVELSGVADLAAIYDAGHELVIGALTTHDLVTRHPAIVLQLPDFARLWRQIANPRIRYTGTIGGNLVSALPHYDALPALLALGGTATVATAASGTQRIALAEPIGKGELLVDVRVPTSPRRLLADRSLHPTLAVYLGADIADDRITQLRIALGGAYARARSLTIPYRGSGQTLGRDASSLAQQVTATLPAPRSDGLATSAYRHRMIEVLTRRLLVRLGSEM